MSAGILGTSYSGSTLLSFILGGHDRIFATSETTTLKRDGYHTECTMCRFRNISCPFWTPDLIDLCLTDMERRYATIEQAALSRLGKDIVIFSDKAPVIYKPLLEASSIDRFIVLFKRPEAFYYSYKKHRMLNNKYDTFEEILMTYIRHYERDLALVDNGFPSFFLAYEDLVNDPLFWTYQVCEFLGVRFHNHMLAYWDSDLHPLTGNLGPYMNALGAESFVGVHKAFDRSHVRWHTENRQSIVPDERWKKELDNYTIHAIRNHKGVQSIFAELVSRRIENSGYFR